MPDTVAFPRSQFVESLSEVSSVLSSRSGIDEVLRRVVDEAKVLVECRKVLLILLSEIDATPLVSSAVVRGSREEYPEAWWRSCIDRVAGEVCETGAARLLEDPEGERALVCVPIRTQDRTIGLLSAIDSHARGFSHERITLLSVLGALAAVAIENARLREQSECALLADERQRIAKEMHDGLAQSLFSASLALEVCKRRVRQAPAEVETKLGETQQLLSESLSELRRYIYDLRPARLERLGLPGAIGSKLEETRRGTVLESHFRLVGYERPLRPSAESCLYRVTQEAIANALRHADAESLHVTLTYAPDAVELRVEDDGVGFDTEAAAERAESGRSLGLRSMRDRVSAEGGRLLLTSAPGSGTCVWVSLPC